MASTDDFSPNAMNFSEGVLSNDGDSLLSSKRQKELELTNWDRFSVVMIGISCVIIVNSIFTDIDFFETYLPELHVLFVIPICLNVPQVVSQLIAIKYLASMPIKLVVLVSLGVSALVSIAMPPFVLTDARAALTIASMIYFGFFMAFINSAAVGFVSSI